MRRRALLLGAAVGWAGVVGLLTFCQPADRTDTGAASAPAADSTGSATTRYAFANQNPHAGYVGAEACAPCHQQIYHDFKQTGKGRAFGRPKPGEGPERIGGPRSVVYDRFSDRYYRAEWRGPALYVVEWQLAPNGRDTTHYRAERADYVIGSGNQTRSFLMERAGYFYELPITWYSAKQLWDLSPGYENGHNTGFSRTVGEQCLGCHNSRNQFVPNSVNQFARVGDGMSCESCHGPGAPHLAKWQGRSEELESRSQEPGARRDALAHSLLAPRSSLLDSSIVNPARLPVTAQLDVCRQCHLEGVTVEKAGRHLTDYRPGLRLADFADVFIPAKPGADATHFGFASHAERLQLSRCFITSSGKLTCSTCHNPHQPLGPRPMATYNQQCQTCHKPEACGAAHGARLAVGNDCVKCHMARSGTTDIPHVSSRDHLIRRKLSQDAAPAPDAAKLKSQLVVLRSFTVSDDSAADERARAVAAMLYFEQQESNPAYLQAVRGAVSQLELAQRLKYAWLAHDPTAVGSALASLRPDQLTDPYAAYYAGQLGKLQGARPDAWLARAVALAPANADLRFEQAAALAEGGDRPAAEAAYRELLRLQPWHKRALLNLGYLRLLQGDYPDALKLTREAKRQDPTYALAWENEANIELQQGHVPQALHLLDELVRRFPAQASKYRELQARIRAAAARN